MARRARKPSLAKHLGADARDFRAIDADARDIQHRVHALQARDKPLGHAGGALASEEVGLYKTMSGAVGLQIRRHTGGSRVYYSYTGKWGAGSGGSFEDMARALEVTLHGKRGVKVVKDFFAHAQSAPPGHAAGRRKRIDPHSADAALEYSIPIEKAALHVLEVARDTLANLRAHPHSQGAVFDAKRHAIIPAYAELAERLEGTGPGVHNAIYRIEKLPNYGEHDHPFTRARKAAAHLAYVYQEAERLRRIFGRATIGDRSRIENALEEVLAQPWTFSGWQRAGFAAGRHAGATPIVWETLAKVVEDSPAVLTPGGAAIVVRAHEPTFRTHVNTAIKLGLLVPVAIPGRKRTDLFTIPPEHQVHLDVRHDRPPVPRPAPAITGVNAFVLQGLSIVNPDLFTGQGTDCAFTARAHPTCAGSSPCARSSPSPAPRRASG